MRFSKVYFQIAVLALTIFALAASPAHAKRKWRYFKAYTRPTFSNWAYDVGLGTALYSGDLSTSSELAMQNYGLNPALSLNGSYHLTEYISLRLGASYFKLNSKSKDIFWVDKSFMSRNAEVHFSLVHEFLPKGDVPYQAYWVHPYVFGGAGVVLFEPRNPDTKERLRTQGNNDGEVYSNYALMFPAGIGLNTYVFDNISAGAEVSYHLCQTDFLDDASNDKFLVTGNDSYYIYRLKVNVQLTSFFNYKKHLRNK
jgi:hypothetical protein